MVTNILPRRDGARGAALLGCRRAGQVDRREGLRSVVLLRAMPGAASYVERNFLDGTVGKSGNPRWARTWALSALKQAGGLREDGSTSKAVKELEKALLAAKPAIKKFAEQ